MTREEEVREVVSEHFDAEIKGIEAPETGISHSTYIVRLENQEIVVKIGESDWEMLPDFEKGFENDAPVTIEVGSKSEVPVPKIYAFDNSGKSHDFRYMISSKVPGNSLTDFFSHPEHEGLIKQLGEIMAELHSSLKYNDSGAITHDDGDLEVEPQSWKSMFKEMVWTLTRHLEDSEYKEFKRRIRDLVERNLDVVENLEQPVLVHQELSGGNVIATEDSINGIVDWERAFSGDPEYDLFSAEIQISQKMTEDRAGLRNNFREIRRTLRRSYREERKLRDGWKRRRYLYYLPFIAQMMWVMKDREGKYETLKRQFEVIEEELE